MSSTVSEILSLISQNLKRSRDSEHIPFGGNLSCVHQHTTFEVPSFTDSKDMIRAKFKKTGHVTPTMPIRGSLSSQGYRLIYSTFMQNLTTLASAVPEI